ncbi:MAG: cytochrome c biogenesis protein CcsA, partial [Deltaproteobacteria bacterium]|nr:cytochrome c biogenesis protein CcsA [Deltaproteobacteria bacterium]
MKYFLISAFVIYALAFLLVLIYSFSKKGVLEKLSRYMLTFGLFLHLIALGIRTSETGHLPMFSMYETLLLYSFTTILVSVIVIFRYNERVTELITIPISLIAMVVAFINESPGRELPLVLQTRWFEFHVSTSFAAYALFTLAFSGAVFYLLARVRGVKDDTSTDSACPASDESISDDEALNNQSVLGDYQDIAGRGIVWGFFFFSASMFSAAVWAYLAWGIYWLWEPKTLWSSIVWFWFAGAMHAWHVKEWRGVGLSIA